MENEENIKIDFTNFDRALAELEEQSFRLIAENKELKNRVVELDDFVNYLIRKYNNME